MIALQYLAGALAAAFVLALVLSTVRVARRRRRQQWILPDRTVDRLERRQEARHG